MSLSWMASSLLCLLASPAKPTQLMAFCISFVLVTLCVGAGHTSFVLVTLCVGAGHISFVLVTLCVEAGPAKVAITTCAMYSNYSRAPVFLSAKRR